jgi:hypothetical protein
MIGIRTALALYAGLTAACFLMLKGSARYLALLIVLGLAAKSVVHYFRRRLHDGND